jgi:hypothetical protein
MKTANITVSIKSESLAPQTNDAEVRALMPRFGEHPIVSSVTICGINTAVANGLRRILLTEMENMALQIDLESWECDDPFIMIDLVTRRVLNIPIVQRAVRPGDKYVLSVFNDSDEPLDVMSASLRATRDHDHPLPFFETFVIITIQPHRRIKFSATVALGEQALDAVYATCSSAIAIPLDERVIDPVTGAPGLGDKNLPLPPSVRYVPSSTITNPHDFLLRFESCGKGDTKFIMKRALTEFINRMEQLRNITIINGPAQTSHSHDSVTDVARDVGMQQIEHVYHMRIPNETRTIGELFVRCALHLFPNLNYAASDINDLSAELIIRFRSHQDNPATIVTKTVDYARDILYTILHHF